MNIVVKYMSNNDCFKAGKKIKPKGIMVHSTATPGIMAHEWLVRWNKPGIEKCVHAFVDDQEVWQYLPWDHRGWHCGGSANNTHIGFEMCEPKDLNDKTYFEKVYANAVELTVMLCKQYGLTEKDVLCHSEGYKKGIASNHADVMHWFPIHGKTMDDFREDVRKKLQGGNDMLLKKGMKGTDIRQLQADLKELGFDPGPIDGIFGDKTLAAVKAFQSKYGLSVDGIAGPATLGKIEIILAQKPEPVDYKQLYETVKKERDQLKQKNATLLDRLSQIKKIAEV